MALANFTGYTLATIDSPTREQCARALIQSAKNLDMAPNPAWEKVLADPDFFDEWGRKIESGEYEDQQILDIAKGDPEALATIGITAG